MFAGFKQFILRGNVIDLAVAVVIGATFGAIVKALVDGFINPLIGLIFQVGDLSGWTWTVPTLLGGTSTFAIGSVVAAVINFVLVALAIYLAIVLPMNKFREKLDARKAKDIEPELLTEQELLVQIRDLLSTQATVPKKP